MVSTRKIATSLHLESISDLTVAARIKPGFVPAFESVTYEGRLRLVLKGLFKMRATAREYYSIKPFVDTADRIQALRSFRFAILPGEPGEPSRLLLAVTFDRAWEPYMRLIWRPLGDLLDLVFCNCEDYKPAFSNSFEDYAAWVRRNQAETNFFFASTGLSVGDLSYLEQTERLYREGDSNGHLHSDREAIRLKGPDPEDVSEAERKANPGGTIAMALEALGALYRLADYYPFDPEKPEGGGDLLTRATRDLLHGFEPNLLPVKLQKAFSEEITWWNSLQNEEKEKERKEKEELETCKRLPPPTSWNIIQRGIVDTYRGANHGCLLLMGITDAAKARAFVGSLQVTPGGEKPSDGVFVNLAFTRSGLERIGMPPHELALLPKEFDEGPEERAGLLGDVREHHPRNWTRPTRWLPRGAAPAAKAPVELSEVDLVVQLRIFDGGHEGHEIVEGHPLFKTVLKLQAEAEASGVMLLAVEAMRTASHSNEKIERTKEHFGFVDGKSQPEAPKLETMATSVSHDATASEVGGDEIPLGDLLWGYRNSRGDRPHPQSAWLDNGSFLVIRKMKQDVGAWKDFMALQDAKPDGLSGEELAAKMMGRELGGNPLAKGATANSNQFTYKDDAQGYLCPLQSHVRRTNPRPDQQPNSPVKRVPRIMRRGMSYGPHRDSSDNSSERGLFFMCYNASIAEQFEVIQRWINGANPTGLGSAQNDPLVGVGRPGSARTFRFLHNGVPVRIPLDDPKEGRNRFVELQWGLYLFAPSLEAIRMIAEDSETWLQPQPQDDLRIVYDEVKHGEAIIAGLERLKSEGKLWEAALGWKTYLEDLSAKDPSQQGDGPAVWAAIRARGGVMRVPYGDWTQLTPKEVANHEPAKVAAHKPPDVAQHKPPEVVMVASRALVDQVLLNTESRYSVSKEAERMKQSFGLMYVGLDSGDQYNAESERPNKEVMKISAQEAFALARSVAEKALIGLFDFFEGVHPENKRHGKLHLHAKFISPVLAGVCRHWFGIPDDVDGSGNVVAGGWSWEKLQQEGQAGRTPRCPGDFMAPSRYIFYPDPLPSVEAYGQAHGKAMYKAVTEHFAALPTGQAPPGKLAATLAGIIKDDLDLLVRTLIGIMTGFLPPADGCLKLALFGWLEEDELWRVQQSLASIPETDEYKRAKQELDSTLLPARQRLEEYNRAKQGLEPALKRAIQRRPAPDTLWRTVVNIGQDDNKNEIHKIGNLEVASGEKIIIGVGSAAAESGTTCDVYPVFGGQRTASPHPTHACPGYEFAFGTMLGILSALLEKCEIRALPAPMMVEISELPPVPEPASLTVEIIDPSPAPSPIPPAPQPRSN